MVVGLGLVASGVASLAGTALGPAALSSMRAAAFSVTGSGFSVSGEIILNLVLEVPGCRLSSKAGGASTPDRDRADPGGKIAGAGPLSSAPNSRSEYVMRSSSTES